MKQQYLICSCDSLQTAFFCGDCRECCEVLGVTLQSFYTMITKHHKFMGFFTVEKVSILEDE